MNLEDVIAPEYGPVDSVHSLQQDDWSLHGGEDGGSPRFGKDNQLEVVGRSGKYYILKCSKCSLDSELFGDGLFRNTKNHLVTGRVPCGCSKKFSCTQDQYKTLCVRQALAADYTFNSFMGEWKGIFTRVTMSCRKHGEWGTTIKAVIDGKLCFGCAVDRRASLSTIPDSDMIIKFLATGGFNKETIFTKLGYRVNGKSEWRIDCPECGQSGISTLDNLQQGKRPCACSPMRQQECYINWVVDENNNAVALKFGIANNSKQRVKQQNSSSIYEVRQYQVYTFPDVSSCKSAERECKKELVCGVVSKTDMVDGYTETTSVLNLNKVRVIYEKWGGILNEST